MKSAVFNEKRGSPPDAHRILAIDGLSPRLPVTLAFLSRIESALQARHRNPELRLSNYFDLIGGEGGGAILAAQLMLGKTVAQAGQELQELGARRLFENRVNPLSSVFFQTRPKENILGRLFGETRLGDVKGELALLAYLFEPGEPFVFLSRERRETRISSRPEWLLRDCLDACLALPPNARPVELSAGGTPLRFGHAALGMSGGAAVPLFLLAAEERSPLRWDMGADRLLLVSVGSSNRTAVVTDDATRRDNTVWATRMLWRDAEQQAQFFLESISVNRQATSDEEAEGDSEGIVPDEPALTYLRYDVELSAPALGRLGLEKLAGAMNEARDLSGDRGEQILREVGAGVAERLVHDEDFSESFDQAALFRTAPQTRVAETSSVRSEPSSSRRPEVRSTPGDKNPKLKKPSARKQEAAAKSQSSRKSSSEKSSSEAQSAKRARATKARQARLRERQINRSKKK